jgi:hypothetical protein
MKCPLFYRTIEMKSKKGKTFLKTFREYTKTDANQACDGEIVAEIDIDEVPDWGKTYTVIKATYTCSKCGEEVHDADLPRDKDGLSDLLTTYVENL